MNFRRYRILPAVFLLAVLLVPPALCADNLTEFITGKNVTSITNYTADLEKDPGTQFYNYGIQSVEIGDYHAAVGFFNKALGENTTMLRKTDALLYLYQGKTFAEIQVKNYSGAVATADAGLTIYSRDPKLWNNRGWALENLGRDQEALAAYDKAVFYCATYTNALINQGNLLTEMGKFRDATAAFSRANETDPFNVAAADGIEAARNAEAESSRTMSILAIVVLVAAIACVVWYVKFRKPSEPETEGKKKRSKKR